MYWKQFLCKSFYKIKNIPGIIRPCITSTLPAINGANTILLDVGSNADCRADVLYQFAVLGSLYSKYVHGVKKPHYFFNTLLTTIFSFISAGI